MSVTGLLFRGPLCRLALNTLLLKHLGSCLANNSASVMRKVASLSAERLPFLKPGLLFVDGLVVCLAVSLGCDTKRHRLHPNYLPTEKSEISHSEENMNSYAYQESSGIIQFK